MEDERTNGNSTEPHPPSGPSAPYLLIVAADGTWTSRPLPTGGALTIGRGVEADIRVDERVVSRLHARLEVAGARELRLIDLDSENGTLVGGKLVRNVGVAVRPGEPILIGRTVITVHVPPAAPAGLRAPAPAPGAAMAGVEELLAKAAPTLLGVLLRGETGVGKDVIAERIHRLSTRARGPLKRINCAGLPPALLESELFGHVRGAFTGAVQEKRGLLEEAAGGTVFLDEIGELPQELQAKLLLVLQLRSIRRVGATEDKPIDVRFLFATHRDLEAEVRGGRFRADFYYRINDLTIHLPPLRERRDEIDGLTAQFAAEMAKELGRDRPPVLDGGARAALHRYAWPGNIRELRSIVRRAVLLSPDQLITPDILVAAELAADALPPPGGDAGGVERERVVAALAACGGNQSRAARLLQISRNTLMARLKKYNLRRPRSKGGLS
jgi:DNA-binding NtrC family response regulator